MDSLRKNCWISVEMTVIQPVIESKPMHLDPNRDLTESKPSLKSNSELTKAPENRCLEDYFPQELLPLVLSRVNLTQDRFDMRFKSRVEATWRIIPVDVSG